jgi:uncharacterized damage-inducible protein DinB
MRMLDVFLQELEQEAKTTRRVLERVPGNKLAWKPHERSMSLGQLAMHIATTPGGVAELSQKSPFPISDFKQAEAATRDEILSAFEESIAKAKSILNRMDDAALDKTWRAVDADGKDVMTIPIGAMLRTIMLNHWYHHRGQLSVYLRQVGAPVPSIYGPSADENPFAKPAERVAATA